ncbi:hypothetical protein [Microbulbifer taiwanensis]
MRSTTHGLALAGLLLFSTGSIVHAQGGFLGIGGDEQNPSLHITPTEIQLDVPMPVNSANLALLLAQAGEGGGLSAMKEAALSKYRQHLEQALGAQLREFFIEEEIPLVDTEGLLTLQNRLEITVVKHFSDLRAGDTYDLERGTIELSGNFHYQIRSLADRALRERSLDITELKIREKYLVKSPKNGDSAEDTTEDAIKLALSKMVEEVLEEIEDDLEAGELRDLLSG